MISHKHKCIFIHIPKTAGMSIYNFFYPDIIFYQDKPNYDILFGWCPKRKLHMQHATAKQLIETELVTEEQWNTYYKFTFVRNPWDRAYSDYMWIQDFANVRGPFKDYINKQKAFHNVFNDRSNSQYLGDHLLPQFAFFELEGKLKMNFVGRFENFAHDIQKILHDLRIDKVFNLNINKSKRKEDYSLFYTNSNKRIVDDKYGVDINNFNYTFEDNRKGWHYLKNFI